MLKPETLQAHWFAYLYEQTEDETELIACMLRLLGPQPMHILEIGCGGGKLCVPLANAGHSVTGMDTDEHMLHIARQKAVHLPGLRLVQGDALVAPWGNGFDAVILGTNLLLNISTTWDYKQAQKQLIFRAADAIRPDGLLILDFDCPETLNAYNNHSEWLCMEGTDDFGTAGKYFVCNSSAEEHNRTVKSQRRLELSPRAGAAFTVMLNSTKHFPTLEEVCSWLFRAGFTVSSLHGGHHGEAFDALHRRAVITARKAAFSQAK